MAVVHYKTFSQTEIIIIDDGKIIDRKLAKQEINDLDKKEFIAAYEQLVEFVEQLEIEYSNVVQAPRDIKTKIMECSDADTADNN